MHDYYVTTNNHLKYITSQRTYMPVLIISFPPLLLLLVLVATSYSTPFFGAHTDTHRHAQIHTQTHTNKMPPSHTLQRPLRPLRPRKIIVESRTTEQQRTLSNVFIVVALLLQAIYLVHQLFFGN